MTDEEKKALLIAYQMIRQQTEQICDLQMLVIPLVQSLQADENLSLRICYLRSQELAGDELGRMKLDSLALVDQAIRRLKYNLGIQD